MDLNDLKNLIRNGERAIIVEDGKPTLVVLSFEGYSQLPRNGGEGSRQRVAPLPSISNGINGIPENDDIAPPEEEFTLDDLPLE